MRPFIHDGDTLELVRCDSGPQVGDVVWLIVDARDLVHRVLSLDPNRGIRIRGDAMPIADGWFDASTYMATVRGVHRGQTARRAPDTKAHRCLVAFLRGLRHIDWKLARLFEAKH